MMTIEIPIKLESLGNVRLHWTKFYRLKKFQQNTVKSYLIYEKTPLPPWHIKLTRIAPRKLDFDNLCYAFKHISDAICAWLIPGLRPGRADADERITIEYMQDSLGPKEYKIRIEITSPLQ